MTARGARRIRMSRIDRMWTGSLIVQTVGPLAVPSRAAVVAALARLAGAGPDARAGLRLDPRSRNQWIYRDDDLEQWAQSCVVSLPPGADDDLDALISRLSHDSSEGHPLRLFLADRHVVVVMTHELGDSRLSLALPSDIVALTQSAALPVWATRPVDPHPLRSAVRHTFLDRHVLSQLLAGRRTTRRTSIAPATPAGRPFVADPVAVTESGRAEDTRSLRAWTRVNAPGAAHFAVVLAAAHQALQENGITCEPGVHMVFDLHRYLPYGHRTTGNFVGGVDLQLPVHDPVAFTYVVQRTAKTGRPLAAATVAAARTMLPRRPAQPPTVAAQPHARLALSYVGPKDFDESLPWTAAAGERSIWCRVDPAGPTAVTLLCAIIDGRLWLSASFHASVFDPAAVRRALRSVHEDAPGLLARTGGGQEAG